MAVELEQTVMNEIGLGASYLWFNGSGSCGHIRKSAVDKLPNQAKKHGLTISKEWIDKCLEANEADFYDGKQYTLTNTWVACSYAIQDAIYREEDGKGFSPDVMSFHFFYPKDRARWEQRTSEKDEFDKWNPYSKSMR